MEEEILRQAMITVSNPSNILFSTLMTRLFSSQQPDFSYEFHLTSNFSPSECLLKSRIASVIIECCKRHGAIQFDSPLFIPKSTLIHQNNSVLLLDEMGVVLELPYDLTFPFARFVAKNRITRLRRYSFAKVYRKHNILNKCREIYECDFDIVSPRSNSSLVSMSYLSEVMKLVVEIIEYFGNSLGPFYLRVNHVQLFDAILVLCGVEKSEFSTVRSVMSTSSFKYSWSQIAAKLKEKTNLNQTCIESLSLYFRTINQLPVMEKILEKLEPLVKKSKIARDACIDLKYLLRHLRTLGLADKRFCETKIKDRIS